jgi:hypothetical protein
MFGGAFMLQARRLGRHAGYAIHPRREVALWVAGGMRESRAVHKQFETVAAE